LSALKHGAFRVAFMLCDRCSSNGGCRDFVAGGQCVRERRVFVRTVSRFVQEYDLEGLADRILVERVAMYMLRISRAEAFEAGSGDVQNCASLGAYIARLDHVLRSLFRDLAVSRLKRMQLEKGETTLVDVDGLMRRFLKAEKQEGRTGVFRFSEGASST